MSVKVLGIDPGSRSLGWGLIQEESGVLKLLEHGLVKPKGKDFSARMGSLYLELASIVKRLAPDEAAIETVFTHKNIVSALKLGQARGVALAACAANNVLIFDYAPTEVKKAVVGVGRADKSQVSFMVGRILGEKENWNADTGDALGCAICHLNQRRINALTKKALEKK